MHSALPILYQEIALCKYLFPQMSNKSVCKWRRGLHGEGEEGERMSDTLRTATIHQVKHTNKSLYKYTFVGSCKAVLAYHDLHPSLRSHSKRPPRPPTRPAPPPQHRSTPPAAATGGHGTTTAARGEAGDGHDPPIPSTTAPQNPNGLVATGAPCPYLLPHRPQYRWMNP